MEKENQTTKTSNSREIEAALIIYHENPDQFIEEFAALTSIGRFPLIAEGTQNIDDIYFDTPVEELKKRGIALRLRMV
ncbi:MAG: CYTH domain-containing protein, partial [bacterium]